MTRKPKWMLDEPKSTRERSKKQETAVAKSLRTGRTTINSGATLGQNDVTADFCEVECKLTAKESFSIKLSDWYKLVDKCHTGKIPMMVIEFEGRKLSLAAIPLEDLIFLLSLTEKRKK